VTAGSVTDESGCYEYRAGYALAAGEEVMVQYGPHNNVDLLFNYGFALRQNTHDHISLGPLLPQLDTGRTDTGVADTGRTDTGIADTEGARNGLREQRLCALLASGLANSLSLTAAEPLEASGLLPDSTGLLPDATGLFPDSTKPAGLIGGSAAGLEVGSPGSSCRGSKEEVSKVGRFELPWHVLTPLRIAYLDETQSSKHWLALSGTPISAANERAALLWLRDTCARLLCATSPVDNLTACPINTRTGPVDTLTDGGGVSAVSPAAELIGVWRGAQLWLLSAYEREAIARLREL